jgi:hypothetical protein
MIYNESFDLHSTTSILVSVNARTEEKNREKDSKKKTKRNGTNPIEIITSKKKRDYKNNRKYAGAPLAREIPRANRATEIDQKLEQYDRHHHENKKKKAVKEQQFVIAN